MGGTYQGIKVTKMGRWTEISNWFYALDMSIKYNLLRVTKIPIVDVYLVSKLRGGVKDLLLSTNLKLQDLFFGNVFFSFCDT